MAAAIRLRHQHADVLADRFGFAVAELSFGGAREKLHDAMLVNHDHRIGDRVQDRAKMPLARPQLVLEALLAVDVDHHAAEPGRGAVGVGNDGAERAHPMTRIRMPMHPVLNVEIASGFDRLLHRLRGAIAILQIKQRKEGVVIDRRVRCDAEQLPCGVGPGQFPGRKLKIPGADARSFDSAAHVLVKRILTAKWSVDVNHARASRLPMRVGFRFQSGDVDRQRGRSNSSAYLIEIKDNMHVPGCTLCPARISGGPQ